MKRLLATLIGLTLLFAAPAIASADDDDEEVEARADLVGDLEIPSVDTDLTGEVRIEIEDGEIEFRVKVKDNSGTIVAGHIHCAGPDANGPVGVTIFAGQFTDEDGEIVRASVFETNEGNGCGWDSVADVAAAIQDGVAYVNVHTVANPSGEIRGNLSPR